MSDQLHFLRMPMGAEREKQIRHLHNRLHKRRVYNKVPKGFTRLNYPTSAKNLQVLDTVDRSTAGRFFLDRELRTLAFEYESDATMFSLSF